MANVTWKQRVDNGYQAILSMILLAQFMYTFLKAHIFASIFIYQNEASLLYFGRLGNRKTEKWNQLFSSSPPKEILATNCKFSRLSSSCWPKLALISRPWLRVVGNSTSFVGCVVTSLAVYKLAWRLPNSARSAQTFRGQPLRSQ